MDAVDFSRGPGTPPDPQRVTPTTASPQCTRGRLRRAGRFLFPFLYAALPAPCTLRAAFDVPFGPQAHSLLEELQVRLPSRQRQPAALAPAAAYATAGASAPFRCIVATTLSTPPSLPRRAASGPAPSKPAGFSGAGERAARSLDRVSRRRGPRRAAGASLEQRDLLDDVRRVREHSRGHDAGEVVGEVVRRVEAAVGGAVAPALPA